LVNDNDVSHSIVHFEVKANYLGLSLSFASKYVASIAFRLSLIYQQDQLHRLLLFEGWSPFLASFRGYLFEEYAHQVLSAGGKFIGCSLDDGTDFFMTLPKKELRIFQHLSECKDENVYYMAAYKRHPCIDSVIVNNGYFQITTAKHHPISRIQMEKIVKK
jgi:hypothetical protein